MKILKELSRQEFKERFATKRDCFDFLAELKWPDGYACKRCGGMRHIKVKQPASRRCSKCGYDESTTTGTLFHKLKFGIDKALEMLYEIATSKSRDETDPVRQGEELQDATYPDPQLQEPVSYTHLRAHETVLDL